MLKENYLVLLLLSGKYYPKYEGVENMTIPSKGGLQETYSNIHPVQSQIHAEKLKSLPPIYPSVPTITLF